MRFSAVRAAFFFAVGVIDQNRLEIRIDLGKPAVVGCTLEPKHLDHPHLAHDWLPRPAGRQWGAASQNQ